MSRFINAELKSDSDSASENKKTNNQNLMLN